MRVVMPTIVQSEALGGSEQDLLVSEYTPRRVFPFSKEGPAGLFLPDEEVRINEPSNKRVSFFIDGQHLFRGVKRY